MKTLDGLHRGIMVLALILIPILAIAQETLTSIRIDVKGMRYSDRMWVFAVEGTTRGFDNGWDAYKMIGTSTKIPTMYAAEETANLQIDAVPDINNTWIAFKAGEDSVYTLTFNNVLIENKYRQVLLFDSVANTTVDITATGTKYSFKVQKTVAPVKRFKLIALPLVVSSDTAIALSPMEAEPSGAPLGSETSSTSWGTTSKDNLVVTGLDGIENTSIVQSNPILNIRLLGQKLEITNSYNEPANVTILNAQSGQLFGGYGQLANTTQSRTLSLPIGVYIIIVNNRYTEVSQIVRL